MSVLRVAWDNSLARRDKAGTGTYAARLLEQFTKHPELRMDVLNGWNLAGKGFAAGATRTAGDLLWTHAWLPALVWKHGADLLHSPAFVAPIVAPCPVVITIHDVTYLLYPSHFANWWTTYLKIVMPPAVRSAVAIVCGSENSKRDIAKAYGIAFDKVRVVPYGVDHERFHPRATLDQGWAQSLGIRDGYVLHVGTFSYRKNIPTLLRAVALLRDKGKWGERQVVLAGSQNLSLKGAPEVFATIRELDLNSCVVLTGHTPDEHVAGLYAHASMLVMPSLYEGFGFPVVEAMAAGTPVVCSNTSSLPEVAGDAAILFPPEDQHALAAAIEDVIENRAVAEELRRKGLEQARQFSWQRNAEQTFAIYRDVAGS
jgi:glycosyltransferase involved in cell wall biosynthesis